MEINYRVNNSESLTDEVIATIVNNFILTKRPKLVGLKDYYKNKTEILNRLKPEPYMPNNKISTNFQRYITDIETGYFLGDPIKYDSAKDPELLDYMLDINRKSSEPSHNARLSKEASKTGIAYELIYLNDLKEIRFAELSSENTFLIRDNSIEDKVIAAVNIVLIADYTKEGADNKAVINVYLKNEIKVYSLVSSKVTFIESKPHYLVDVPVVEYRNSDEAIGSYEDHISTLNAYNEIMSDVNNDIEQFANAIMVISADEIPDDKEIEDENGNVIATIPLSQTIKTTRTMFLPSEGSATYLHKPSDNVGAFTAMQILKSNLLMLTGVPDFGEGLSGNLSAAAIKSALFAFEQRLKNKENNFKFALDERLRLLIELINFKHNTNFDYLDVKYTFTLNTPDNFSEAIQFARDTEGILSKRTRISKLVKDVDAELDLIAQAEELLRGVTVVEEPLEVEK